MARQRFVWIEGRGLVEVFRQPPRPRVHIQGDTAEPFRSMADGRMYTSVSRYKAEVKARGFEIVGDEKRYMMDQPKPDVPDYEVALRQTASELGMSL